MNYPANNLSFKSHVIARLGFDPAPMVAAELALGHITITVPQFKTDPKTLDALRAQRRANIAAGLTWKGTVPKKHFHPELAKFLGDRAAYRRNYKLLMKGKPLE